jgi:hypothetical protein
MDQNQPDQTRIVASLASEFHVPIGGMATLNERARAGLAMDAHITEYLRKLPLGEGFCAVLLFGQHLLTGVGGIVVALPGFGCVEERSRRG